MNGWIEPVANLESRGSGGDGFAEPALRFADGNGDADGEAALACAAKRRVGNDLGGCFRIGIGQDDDVVLSASLALHALAAGRAAGVDVLGHGRGTHEADSADKRVIEERIDRWLAAVDEVDHAWRASRFPG